MEIGKGSESNSTEVSSDDASLSTFLLLLLFHDRKSKLESQVGKFGHCFFKLHSAVFCLLIKMCLDSNRNL